MLAFICDGSRSGSSRPPNPGIAPNCGALAESETADLAGATMRRWTIAPVPLQASLRQAMDTIRASTVEAVCVYERSRATGKRILHGVVTRESIEKFTLERL